MATLGGPALPVVVQNGGQQQGGAAIPVTVVSDGRAVQGGPATPIYIATSGPRQAGPALPVVAAPYGARVAGGDAVPAYIVGGGYLPSGYESKIIALSPIAYWPMDEASGAVANDRSGNSRNGAYSNVTLGAAGIGDGSTAAAFDGTASFCNIYSASLNGAWNGQLFTAAAWVQVSAAGVWTDGTTRRPLYISVDNNNRVFFERPTNNNRINVVYIAGGTNKTVSINGLSSTGWLHLAVTVDKAADQMIVYLNGVQQGATQTGLGAWAGVLAATRTIVGASITTPLEVWSGQIAHVALFSSALSAAQVASLATL